jgi:chemotaxis protein MotB
MLAVAVLAGCVSLEAHNETAAQLEKARKVLTQAGEEIKSLRQDKVRLEQDKARFQQEAEALKKSLADLEHSTVQAKEEMAKLRTALDTAEREGTAREAKIQELARARDDLAKSLEAEIAKNEVSVRQVQDQLAVSMTNQVLFRSGQTEMTPEGVKLLKQVAETLKTVSDKQIRIEGHTDSKGIGHKLRDRYPTNWELSTARAASVVRYLVQEGGLDRANLTVVGYADTRPVASNDTRAGRQANRRIEIVLLPKAAEPSASVLTAPSANSR